MASKKAPTLPPREHNVEAEKQRRLGSAVVSKRPLLRKRLFKEQLALMDDPSQFSVAICSRRAGKTFCVSSMLIDVAMKHPNCRVLYITLSRQNAKELVWDEPDSGILTLNEELGLGGEANNTELALYLPNGSVIRLTGCDTQREVRKVRGKKYRLVIIDEAQDMEDEVLQDLLKNVLPKTLQDLRGRLILTGTPGIIASGPFFDISTGKVKKWSIHRWTQLENVFYPECLTLIEEGRAKSHAEAVAVMRQQELEENGWDETEPAYVRETLGLWFTDYQTMLFRYDPRKNDYDGELPDLEWKHVVGADVGFEDATAFVVWAYADEHPTAYEVHSEKKKRMLMPDVRERVAALMAQYDAVQCAMDPSAGGKALIEELSETYGLNVEVAERSEKAAFIEMMNGEIAGGRVKVLPDGELAKEWKSLRRDPKTGIEMQTKKDICDTADAGLYSWRLINRFRGEQREERAPTRQELSERDTWLEQHERLLEERFRERREQAGDDW